MEQQSIKTTYGFLLAMMETKGTLIILWYINKYGKPEVAFGKKVHGSQLNYLCFADWMIFGQFA